MVCATISRHWQDSINWPRLPTVRQLLEVSSSLSPHLARASPAQPPLHRVAEPSIGDGHPKAMRRLVGLALLLALGKLPVYLPARLADACGTCMGISAPDDACIASRYLGAICKWSEGTGGFVACCS